MAEAASGNIPLPVIDLKKAKDPAQRLAVAKQLVEALETVGFLFVDNVDGFDPDSVLKNSRWFYDSLSQEDRFKLARRQWNPQSQNRYRGFFPTQTEEDSFKEGLEICQDWTPGVTDIDHKFLIEGNVWPQGMPGADQFRQDMNRYYKWAALDASVEILRLTSLGCGLEENWFDSMFLPDSLSTLRLLHFPTRPEHTVHDALKEKDTIITCSAHHDSGILTLLATFNYDGLQIQLEEGQWLSVPRRPQSLVMNIGLLLSAISGGRFKATRHRVVDIKAERNSVPFFLEPHYGADITRVMPRVVEGEGESSPPATHPVNPGCEQYGAWLADKLRRFAEYKDLGVSKPQG